jgi:hypothetical protein
MYVLAKAVVLHTRVLHASAASIAQSLPGGQICRIILQQFSGINQDPTKTTTNKIRRSTTQEKLQQHASERNAQKGQCCCD